MAGRGEIVAIGNELTSGLTPEGSAQVIARKLLRAGLEIRAITCIGDDPADIEDALGRALKRSAFVIVSGGLGPTDDDLTAEAAAKALGRELIFDPEFLSHIERHFRALGLIVGPNKRKLAQIPEGAWFLDPGGQTCGFYLEQDGKLLFFLPGIPGEAVRLAAEKVIPLLAEALPERVKVRRLRLKVIGLEEFDIGELCQDVKREGIALAYLPSGPEHHLVLTARGDGEGDVLARLERVETRCRTALGTNVFGADDETLEAVVGRLLKERGLTLALAESCTGGLIGHRLTEVPGSSGYFPMGLVTYSNEAKVRLLGVPEDIIKRFGAVSAECAEAMAVGVRKVSGADIGLSVTGIAGPTGGSPGKPVGTVWFGLADGTGVLTEHRRFRDGKEGGRAEIKQFAGAFALDLLRRRLIGAD